MLDEYYKFLLKDLTPEQKIEQAATIRMMKHMESSERIKLAKALIDYYKSKEAFVKMQEVTELINKYLGDNRDYENLEEKILKLPKNRLILPEDTESKEIYEEYKNSIYNLILFLNFKGNRTLLDKSDEIKEIVARKSELDSTNIYLEKQGMPLKTEEELNLKTFITPIPLYSSYEDLKKIYVYKNKDNIMVGEFTEEINKKKIEVVGARGDVTTNKSVLKSLGKKIALYTTLYVGVFVGSIALGKTMGKLFADADANRISNVRVTTETQDGTSKNVLDMKDVLLHETILREYLDKERKYVTVFGDTVNNEFDVKVYDYTDTNFTDEELKTIELNSNNLIYDSVHRVRDMTEKESLYGVYTGKNHRDVSTVNFYSKYTNPESTEDYQNDVALNSFLGAFICIVMGEFAAHVLTLEEFRKTINDYKNGRFNKSELLNKLQRLIEDLEVLQVKEELNKEVNKLYTEQSVDNELNEYTTISR